VVCLLVFSDTVVDRVGVEALVVVLPIPVPVGVVEGEEETSEPLIVCRQTETGTGCCCVDRRCFREGDGEGEVEGGGVSSPLLCAATAGGDLDFRVGFFVVDFRVRCEGDGVCLPPAPLLPPRRLSFIESTGDFVLPSCLTVVSLDLRPPPPPPPPPDSPPPSISCWNRFFNPSSLSSRDWSSCSKTGPLPKGAPFDQYFSVEFTLNSSSSFMRAA
jgi:hypothetical protein